MNINVLHILPSLNLTGGTAAKVKQLALHSSHKNYICTINNQSNISLINNWQPEKIHILPILTRQNPITDGYAISKIVKKYNINIIHTYYNFDTISAYITKSIFHNNIKIVRSFEGVLKFSVVKKIIFSNILSHYDGLIYISNYIKYKYTAIFKSLNTLNNSIIYNPPGFEIDTANNVYHLTEDRYFVCISGLNKYKNLYILIDIIAILREKGIKCRVDIIGDGPNKSNLISKIEEYNLNDCIKLLGYKNNVKEYLDKATLYLHPADLEGFGMSVIEAMSRRCAVIVSNAAALPEIISDNIDGVLANPYDANDWVNKIIDLLNSQEKITFLGENAYKKVCNNFSVDKYCSNLDNFYYKLCAQKI